MQQHERVELNDSPIAVMYQRQAPLIFAYLCHHTSSREDAEDLLLEVFLAALEHHKFPALGEKEQQAWLWAVARNKVVDHYRRSTRHPSVTLKQVAETVYENEEKPSIPIMAIRTMCAPWRGRPTINISALLKILRRVGVS